MLDEPRQRGWLDKAVPIVQVVVLVLGLYLVSWSNYLLFHSLSELFSIAVAWSVFALAWNAQEYMANDLLLLLGISSLFVGGFDLVHTLAYKGMGVFPTYDADLPTQLWIAARSMQSISFLVGGLLLNRPQGRVFRRTYAPHLVFAIYAAVTALVLSTIFLRSFPTCYIEGTGLTSFKRISEYGICLILLASAILLVRRRQHLNRRVFHLLLLAIFAMVVAELAFTFYVGVYDLSNMVGHLFKIAAFFALYRAIVFTGLQKPYTFLSQDLRSSEAHVRQLNAELEQLVQERTKALEEAREQLLRREKLALLGQLAGSVGHELRNPLGVISNAVYYLNMVLGDAGESVGEYLGMISAEVETATKIIGDLLDLGRVKTGDRRPAPVARLVKEALARFPAPEGIHTGLDLPADLPPVVVDGRQIEQVLVNLVTNAYQAMPEGGALTIRGQEEGSMVALSVSDTGQGIAAENLDKVFEPLFTTKARGIGLGLALSQSLATANGGQISVESAEGQGTTFTLTLPTREGA